MSFNFTLKVRVNDVDYLIAEPSFYDYKNLVKTIFDDDTDIITTAFDNFLCKFVNVDVDETPNITKFLLLLKLRTLILGNNIDFDVNDMRVTYNLNKIFDHFNVPLNTYSFNMNGNTFEFRTPSTLKPNGSVFDFIMDCLYKIDGIPITKEDKPHIPALPITTISNEILESISMKFDIEYVNQTLWSIDGSFLAFLKSVFSYNIEGLYDLEYVLRRNLNFSAQDFTTLSFAECNVLFKNYEKEVTEAAKKNNIDKTINSDI